MCFRSDHVQRDWHEGFFLSLFPLQPSWVQWDLLLSSSSVLSLPGIFPELQTPKPQTRATQSWITASWWIVEAVGLASSCIGGQGTMAIPMIYLTSNKCGTKTENQWLWKLSQVLGEVIPIPQQLLCLSRNSVMPKIWRYLFLKMQRILSFYLVSARPQSSHICPPVFHLFLKILNA